MAKISEGQLLNGIINYANAEIVEKLPTMGKWVMGTGITMISNKGHDLILLVQDNQIAKSLGIVDENGMFEIDELMKDMKESAKKYGKAYIDIPLLGKMSFDASDIEKLHEHIMRG